jgi:hypothetical protein
MIIFLIDYLTERISEFKRRNRNRPSYYRYFLIWLSFLILITAIFYSLGLFDIWDKPNIEELNSYKIDSILPKIEELNSYKIESTLPINKRIPVDKIQNIIPVDKIQNIMPPATVLQTNAAYVPQIPLYDEVLKIVSNIPPPLNFVDDYKFEL